MAINSAKISEIWSDVVKCAKFVCSCVGVPLSLYAFCCCCAGRDLAWRPLDITKKPEFPQ